MQLVYEASCICSPSAVKKRHLFPNVQMLRLDFSAGLLLSDQVISYNCRFLRFYRALLQSRDWSISRDEASHGSLPRGGDRCKTQSNHLSSSAAVHTQALELQQGLARKQGGSHGFFHWEFQSDFSKFGVCSAGQIQLPSSSWLYQCKEAESTQGSKSISVPKYPSTSEYVTYTNEAGKYNYPLCNRNNLGTPTAIVNLWLVKLNQSKKNPNVASTQHKN